MKLSKKILVFIWLLCMISCYVSTVKSISQKTITSNNNNNEENIFSSPTSAHLLIVINEEQEEREGKQREKEEEEEIGKFDMSGMTFTNGKYCPQVTFSSSRASSSLSDLSSTGSNWVAIIVTQYMDTHNSTTIYPLYTPIKGKKYTYITATEEALTQIIHQAHSLGLSVMLKPHVDLTKDDKYWRGDIGKGFNKQQWDAWFKEYERFIIQYAVLAESLHVEQLSMSCELIEASKQDHHWRQVINQTRQVYHGVLTDAANWGYLNATGGEATNKTWWDAVDLIGIDAYYPICQHNCTNPLNVEELVEHWRPAVERAKNLSVYWGKPLAYTEIGYCSGKCHEGSKVTQEDLKLQAIHYEAVFKAFQYEHSWFKGVFWWNWPTDNAFGGEENSCMTPQWKKPVTDVLRKYYRAKVPEPPRPSYPPECICTE